MTLLVCQIRKFIICLKQKQIQRYLFVEFPALNLIFLNTINQKKIINSSTNILYISTPFEKKTEISINNNQDIFFDEKDL